MNNNVWVVDSEVQCLPIMVANAEGTLDPEEWVTTFGVQNYPEAIYFFAELVNLEV